MNGNAWLEVDRAKDESRHELVLNGDTIAARISENGLDERIFTLTSLNFLELSKCGLTALPDIVRNLNGLTNLVLHGNRLTVLPESIGQLCRLKLLDLSSNELELLPVSVRALQDLQTLNVSCNRIVELPDPSALVSLHVLDVSHNCLTTLPDALCCSELSVLATILANNNSLETLPQDLFQLPSLRLLDVTSNKITELPSSLSECRKLKELKVGSNPVKDKRLLKMLDQCSTKACLDYLHNVFEKEQKKGKSSKGGPDKREKKKRGAKSRVDEEAELSDVNRMTVVHFSADESLTVQVTPDVLNIRPFIVCCAIRNLNLNKSSNMMRRFISLQTKLHDSICAKRQLATIATHDLEALKAPLTYDARPPANIKLIPLLKKNEKSAMALMRELQKEAEEMRKEKKRNTVSGIHRYLDLLKGKSLYPCLLDSSDVVISFPPITNSDVTKVTKNTRHVFVEVTSSSSLEVCKKVMEELLRSLLEMGIGQADIPADTQGAAAAKDDNDDDDEATRALYQDATSDDVVDEAQTWTGLKSGQVLVVQQVKIIDNLGGLRVIFPSKVDLLSDSYRVSRDYD